MRFLIFPLLIILLPFASCGQDEQDEQAQTHPYEHLNILCIGNSFSMWLAPTLSQTNKAHSAITLPDSAVLSTTSMVACSATKRLASTLLAAGRCLRLRVLE